MGLACALAGLVYLVFPGLSAPPPIGSTLMVVAGISWGCYSLWGRSSTRPIGDTAINFVRAVPFAVAVSLVTLSQLQMSVTGGGLAAASGVVASGLGYVVRYAALPGLTATRAATVQLSVPVLAGAAGAVFLPEPVSLRLVLSALLILGGIGLAVGGGRH